MQEAQANPVERPLGRLAKIRTKHAVLPDSADGGVSVPEDDEPAGRDEPEAAVSVHTEIQYLLVKLGAEMGFDVHVARNDQSRVWKGQRLGDMPRRREQLPQQSDPMTYQTIELIDVPWLDGNAIVAAFEIESTTSIYSGLLRMSDLVARQPSISVPLFLVAPDERREKVIQQVNRPTFERMKPPLVGVPVHLIRGSARGTGSRARLRLIPQTRLAPDNQRIVCSGRSLTSKSKPQRD